MFFFMLNQGREKGKGVRQRMLRTYFLYFLIFQEGQNIIPLIPRGIKCATLDDTNTALFKTNLDQVRQI